MRKKILFLAGMMACSSLAGAQEISKTWVADKGMELIRTRFFMLTIQTRISVQLEMISI